MEYAIGLAVGILVGYLCSRPLVPGGPVWKRRDDRKDDNFRGYVGPKYFCGHDGRWRAVMPGWPHERGEDEDERVDLTV